jgi:site-specific DNA-methyltransferase (adenine-specific)
MASEIIADKRRAGRNRTLALLPGDAALYGSRLRRLHGPASLSDVENATINQDLFDVLDLLPSACVDLLFIDPPYNLTRRYNSGQFTRLPPEEYVVWMDSWLSRLVRTLKPTGSAYICADWGSSSAVSTVAARYLTIRNRITWEREKGRGAKANWKNCSEDIWYCTRSDSFTFNLDAVKVKRRVIAPYKDANGRPKDWLEDEEGCWRTTHPSNLWTDITVPFWSMPENTEHPTQKPEKLLAKVLLASSNPGDLVLDPFVGSGTTSVVAKKLGRRYVGVESDVEYCLMTEKRLAIADQDKSIQGYDAGTFWDRNSGPAARAQRSARQQAQLFEEDPDG